MCRYFSGIICLLLGLYSKSRANDMILGGTASDLVPIESTEVRMLSEDILIRETGVDYEHNGGEWDISAEYVFFNQSDKDVDLQVGFPEHRCDRVLAVEKGTLCNSEYRNMRTAINGVWVKHRKGELDKSYPWASRIRNIWVYDARFPAGERVKISHQYRVSQDVDSMEGRSGTYITESGSLWAGSIGHARFRVWITPDAKYASLYYSEDRLTPVTTQLIEVDGKKIGELLLEIEDWNPKGNISFSYNFTEIVSDWDLWLEDHFKYAPERAGFDKNERCPAFADLVVAGRRLSDHPEDEELIIDNWEGRDFGSRRICRNQVFASYGRRFQDDALNRYFYGPEGFVASTLYFPFREYEPNDRYNDKMLTKGDWATLRLLDLITKVNASHVFVNESSGKDKER